MRTKQGRAPRLAAYMMAASVLTLALSAIALSGTAAWQSVRQAALNEVQGALNPGARLHDDFNGSNKDIYVENYTDPDDGGVPVYVRVRLLEYMETGSDAGARCDDPLRDATSIVEGSVIGDESTWVVHKSSDFAAADVAIAQYWDWETGGWTVYLPTFNKDKDSLRADINGTYAGPDGTDGVYEGDTADRYFDYREFESGQTVVALASYDADDNALDDGNVSYVEETHEARPTLGAAVVDMASWVAYGCPVGEYWVYDVDGWAYWASPLEPGTATGLLLSGIEPSRLIPDGGWYYAIVAEGQFVTASDIPDFALEENGSCTVGGKGLLNAISSKIEVRIAEREERTETTPGSTLDFNAEFDYFMPPFVEVPPSSQARWSVLGALSDSTFIDQSGLLHVGADETASTLVVRAENATDTAASATFTVGVRASLPADLIGVIA